MGWILLCYSELHWQGAATAAVPSTTAHTSALSPHAPVRPMGGVLRLCGVMRAFSL